MTSGRPRASLQVSKFLITEISSRWLLDTFRRHRRAKVTLDMIYANLFITRYSGLLHGLQDIMRYLAVLICITISA